MFPSTPSPQLVIWLLPDATGGHGSRLAAQVGQALQISVEGEWATTSNADVSALIIVFNLPKYLLHMPRILSQVLVMIEDHKLHCTAQASEY